MKPSAASLAGPLAQDFVRVRNTGFTDTVRNTRVIELSFAVAKCSVTRPLRHRNPRPDEPSPGADEPSVGEREPWFVVRAIMRIKLASVAFTLLAACAAEVTPAVQGPVRVERATECRANCAALGMELQSVVLILNNAGCVCQATPPPTISGGAAAASGGAVIAAMLAQEEADKRRAEEEEKKRDDAEKDRKDNEREEDERRRKSSEP